jgi:hypothetical protein
MQICQTNNDTHRNIKLPLAITDTKTPWEKVYLGIVGPLPLTENGIKYILTCLDNLSKYFIAMPLQSQRAEEVTNAFVKNIVLIYGIPIKIVTDQGQNFMSECSSAFANYLRLKKFLQQHITPRAMEP